eukprot:TCONS_00031368-protein
MALESPSQLFAQLQTKEDSPPQLTQTANGQRLLMLRDVGTASSNPDRIKCIISCSSCKNTSEEAKSSTTRRVDYIKQTLRNHSVSEKQYSAHSLLSTTSSDSNENKFVMSAEVCVVFHDTDTYEKAVSFLVEKLETSIRVSEAVFYVSPEKISDLRRQACLNAVRNCRTKALSIAQYLNQTLGSAVTVREEDTSEIVGNSTSHEPNAHQLTSDKHAFDHVISSIQRKIADGTVNVSVNVYMEFECKERTRKSNQTK